MKEKSSPKIVMRTLFFVTLSVLVVVLFVFYPRWPTSKTLRHQTVEHLDMYTKWTHSPNHILTPHTIRIIVPSGSIGTATDAEIYNKLIPGSKVLFIDYDEPSSHPEAAQKSDINIYIEDIPNGDSLFPCSRKILMFNQDVSPVSCLARADVVMCKTRYALSLVVSFPGLKGKCVYVPHSSNDVLSDGVVPSKDYNLFVHLAGKSHLKNTAEVLDAWLEAKGFPEMGYPRLVITCKNGCLSPAIRSALTSFVRKEDGQLVHPLYPNIEVWDAMPSEKYVHLQKLAGFYICPSLTEGYGHYINEGRGAGAVVISTDGPPMNELITPEIGILVKPVSSGPSPNNIRGGSSFKISSDEVQKAVRIAKSLPREALESMGRKARDAYLRDTFEMADVISLIIHDDHPTLPVSSSRHTVAPDRDQVY